MQERTKQNRAGGTERKLSPAEVEKVAQLLANNGNMSNVAEAVGLGKMNITRAIAHANNPKVQTRAQELIRTKFERRNITGDRVMTELARLAFASAKDMFDPETGRMLSIHEMDDDTAATVVAFDVEDRFEGRGDAATPYKTTKVRRGDKLGALTILAKHFKLVNDSDGVNALAGALADRLNAAKKRITPLEDPEDARIIEPVAIPDQHETQSREPEQYPDLPAADQTDQAAAQGSPASAGDDDEETLW